jgi:Fe2+ or Zn2+ uptake regulation protein
MLKKSRVREGILEILSRENFHPTVEEIYGQLQQRFPAVGIASVYRNIDQLIQNGHIKKIATPDGPGRLEGNLEKHYHFRCSRCGAVSDVWLQGDWEAVLENDCGLEDFSVSGFHIEFHGVCKKCGGSTAGKQQ